MYWVQYYWRNSRKIICVGTPALSTPCPGSLNPMKAVEEIIEGTEGAKKKKSQKGRGRSGSQSGPCRFTYFNGSSCTSGPRKVCPSFFVLILFFLLWPNLVAFQRRVMKIILHNILYLILKYMQVIADDKSISENNKKRKDILKVEILHLEKY